MRARRLAKNLSSRAVDTASVCYAARGAYLPLMFGSMFLCKRKRRPNQAINRVHRPHMELIGRCFDTIRRARSVVLPQLSPYPEMIGHVTRPWSRLPEPLTNPSSSIGQG